jgi:hypothetical protein
MKKVFLIFFALQLLTSCTQKGCTDEIAKNYDKDASKDDESCEYYTNTEFLTMNNWKGYGLDVENPGSFNEYYKYNLDSYQFNENGSALFEYGDTITSENWNWQFNSNETQIILNDGSNNLNLEISKLTATSFNFSFIHASSGAKLSISTVR